MTFDRAVVGFAQLDDDRAQGLFHDGWSRIGYFAWIQTPMSATRLSGIEGLDDVAALPHVASVAPNRRQGDALDWAMGGRSNVCQVLGSVEVIGDLAAARDEIDDTITLEFEEDPQESVAS